MTMQFANLKNGTLSIDTYRHADATATDVTDLLRCFDVKAQCALVASIDTEEDKSSVEKAIGRQFDFLD